MLVSTHRISDVHSLRSFEDEQTNRCAWDALLSKTVYRVLRESAQAFEATTAVTFVRSLEDAPVEVTHRQLFEGITRTANLFGQLAGPGCGVAYILPSLVQTHFVLWGAESCGYAVPLNPFLQATEIADLFKASGARIFVFPKGSDPQVLERVAAVRAAVPDVLLVAVGSGECHPDWVDYEPAVAAHRGDQAVHFDDARSSDAVVAYFHTGGTTGLPKLVSHTSRNQLAAAHGAAVMLSLQRDDCMTNGMPLFHVGGAISSSLSFFLSGARILMLSAMGLRNPEMVKGIWKLIERHQATILGAVPTALGAILNVPIDASIASLRWGLTGAASCPRSIVERFHFLTGLHLHELLGMTESGGVTAVDPVGGTPTPGSVGYGVPFTRLRVRKLLEDGLGDECAPDEVGVLFVEGAHVSGGYLDASQNAGVFMDGGLNSGDLAYRDDAGKLFIAGRSKDLIIRSGHNIDPGMIEEAFAQHPAVALVAAVSQPDEYAGELPVVFVSLRPGMHVEGDQLETFARERISERPAWPKAVHIIETMPVTAVGKIFKPVLRAEAAERLLIEKLGSIEPDAIQSLRVTAGGKRGLQVDVHLASGHGDLAPVIEQILKGYIFTWSVHLER